MAGAPDDAGPVSPFPITLSAGSQALLVIAVLFAALALRLALFPVGPGLGYITFVPGVALVALLAGIRAALVYAAIATLLGIVLFHPQHAGDSHLVDLVPMAQFFANGAAIAFAIHFYQRWVVTQQRELRASLRELSDAQERLLASDARFQAFMDAAPALAWLSDADGRPAYLNRSWERASGQPRERWLGRTGQEIDAAGIAGPGRDGDAQVLRTGVGSDAIEAFGEVAGMPRLWRVVRFPVPAQDGSPLVGGMAIDITSQMRAEAALRQSEARTLAIITSASDAIVSTDAQGLVRLFNPAAERMFGLTAATMLGNPLDRLLPDEASGHHRQHLVGFARSGVSQRAMSSGRVAALHADGSRMELEASISQVEVDGSVMLTAMLRNVTERTRAERRLVAYQLELAGLNRRLLAQEKETTRRLAQALHDELGQTLAALRMQFDVLRQRGYIAAAAATAADAGEAAPGLQRIDALITHANRQVRETLTELRPPLLDELGLVAAIENELRRQSEAGSGPELSLDVDAALRDLRWSGDVEFAAFMVAREAAYNAIRHARARRVRIVIEGDPSHMDLWIDDDGIGMPEEPRQARPGHLGLVGMRERAASIGASLMLGPADRPGTRVHLNWQAPANVQRGLDESPVPDR